MKLFNRAESEAKKEAIEKLTHRVLHMSQSVSSMSASPRLVFLLVIRVKNNLKSREEAKGLAMNCIFHKQALYQRSL
jgi:hypothetical protein